MFTTKQDNIRYITSLSIVIINFVNDRVTQKVRPVDVLPLYRLGSQTEVLYGYRNQAKHKVSKT